MIIAIDIREAVKKNKTGKGRYTEQLVEELLAAHPDDQFLLYTDQPYPVWEHFANAQQKFFPPSSLRWHIKVVQDLKKIRPDVFWSPTSYIIAALAPKWLKVVITIHDLVAWLYPTRHNFKATIIERLTLPFAIKKITKAIAVSENTKRDLHHFFPKIQGKVEVIPCAASTNFTPLTSEEKEHFRARHHLPEHFILAVGTLEPRKNFITLIKAFAEVQKNHSEYVLIIIGGKGWYFEKIFKTVRDLGAEDSVIFAGYVDEDNLAGYYNTATCLVFPSLYEGFGIPPLEAMKSGCPVIASNTSSIPEVVGTSAILISPSSVAELAAAIEKVIDEPELQKELHEKGLAQAEKFSWHTSAEKVYNALTCSQPLTTFTSKK